MLQSEVEATERYREVSLDLQPRSALEALYRLVAVSSRLQRNSAAVIPETEFSKRKDQTPVVPFQGKKDIEP